jgi:hypothetical protein
MAFWRWPPQCGSMGESSLEVQAGRQHGIWSKVRLAEGWANCVGQQGIQSIIHGISSMLSSGRWSWRLVQQATIRNGPERRRETRRMFRNPRALAPFRLCTLVPLRRNTGANGLEEVHVGRNGGLIDGNGRGADVDPMLRLVVVPVAQAPCPRWSGKRGAIIHAPFQQP